jgi:hypothetical protein
MFSLHTYVRAGGPLLTLNYRPPARIKPMRTPPRPSLLTLAILFAHRGVS